MRVGFGLHDLAEEVDFVIELTTLGCRQLAQRFDGDGEVSTGSLLMPNATDNAIDE